MRTGGVDAASRILNASGYAGVGLSRWHRCKSPGFDYDDNTMNLINFDGSIPKKLNVRPELCETQGIVLPGGQIERKWHSRGWLALLLHFSKGERGGG